MTIEKNIWADIQDGVTQGLAAAELVNDNKRAVNELVDVVNGLGTASTWNVTTSANDNTPNRVMKTGDGGILGTAIYAGYGPDLNDLSIFPVGTICSFEGFVSGAASKNAPNLMLYGYGPGDPVWGNVHTYGTPSRLVQTCNFPYGHIRKSFIRYRHDEYWYPWQEVQTDKNLTSTDFDATLGRIVKVGDYGLGRLDNAPFVGVELNPDDYRVGGFYIGNFTVYGTFRTGFLTVHAGSGSGVCAQEFIDWDAKKKFFRLQTAGVWQPWQELFHTGSILGTVSQSGGVPTGAIIERGSNANGEFVKYADGTMICTIDSLSDGRTAAGLNTHNWTLPAAFVNGGYFVTAIARSTAPQNISAPAVASKTTTVASIRVNRADASATAWDHVAIGRWY